MNLIKKNYRSVQRGKDISLESMFKFYMIRWSGICSVLVLVNALCSGSCEDNESAVDNVATTQSDAALQVCGYLY